MAQHFRFGENHLTAAVLRRVGQASFAQTGDATIAAQDSYEWHTHVLYLDDACAFLVLLAQRWNAEMKIAKFSCVEWNFCEERKGFQTLLTSIYGSIGPLRKVQLGRKLRISSQEFPHVMGWLTIVKMPSFGPFLDCWPVTSISKRARTSLGLTRSMSNAGFVRVMEFLRSGTNLRLRVLRLRIKTGIGLQCLLFSKMESSARILGELGLLLA